MGKKGIIFDLDGVIVDTAKYHYLAWKDLADSLEIHFDEIMNEQLKGVSRIRSLEKILEWGNKRLTIKEFDKHLIEKNAEYLSYIDNMDASEILPDVERVLKFAKENNQAIALGSASKNARAILEKVNLINHFDAIVDGNDVSKAKPDPEVFLIASEKLGVQPNNCVVFEDAVAGIQAANTAKMKSIGIGHSEVLYEANHIFKDFTEMTDEFLMNLINEEPNI